MISEWPNIDGEMGRHVGLVLAHGLLSLSLDFEIFLPRWKTKVNMLTFELSRRSCRWTLSGLVDFLDDVMSCFFCPIHSRISVD